MPTHPHVGWGFLISLALHVTGIAALSLALPRLNVRPGVVRQVEFAVLEAPQETTRAAATTPPPAAASSNEALTLLPAPTDNAEVEVTAAPAPNQSASAAAEVAAPTAPHHSASAAAQVAAPTAPNQSTSAAAEAAATTAPNRGPNAAPQASPSPKKPPARKAAATPLAAASPRQVSSATRPDPSSDGSALQRVLQQIAATTELTQDERRKAMLVVLRTWEDPSGKHSAEELIDALLKEARKARAGAAPAEP